MEAIRAQIQKPLVVGVGALIVGIILGILYGWAVDPVEWTDAAVYHMRADLQEEYLRMAIDSYAQNQDINLAVKRFQDLGSQGQVVLDQIAADPASQRPETVQAFRSAVQAVPSGVAGGEETGPTAEPSAGRSLMRVVLPVMCIVTLFVAAGLIYMFVWRPRGQGGGEMTPAMEAQLAAREADMTDYAALGEEPPIVQFAASYKIGDDLFDDSFSIDAPSGEFLGECGVGISETVGVGEPKKVTAFEVWLFDKNDIQTVTKVLMSAHAFLDEATRQRLVARGEPVLAEPGTEMVLETKKLHLVARVVDMEYGQGATPDHSFFDQIIIELAAWLKPGEDDEALDVA